MFIDEMYLFIILVITSKQINKAPMFLEQLMLMITTTLWSICIIKKEIARRCLQMNRVKILQGSVL